jgi:hypothetical protein
MKNLIFLLMFACAESKSSRKPIESVPLEAPQPGAAPAPQLQPTESGDTDLPPPAVAVSAAPTSAAPAGPLASTAECAKLLDHYFDVVLAADVRAMGAPPEAIAQAKAMARGEGDPCAEKQFTKKQYQCGIKAKTKDAYESCMR